MDAFVSWLDKPFDPRRPSKPGRRRTGCVTIRYRGSIVRSAVKTLIVLALLAIMSNIVGERSNPDLGANVVAGRPASAGTGR